MEHVKAASADAFPVISVIIEHEGKEKTFPAEVCLVATGRKANVNGLGLEEADVEYTRHGVTINDVMQTSNPDVYAVGDVATPYKFTHVAGTMAQMVVQNALFGGDNGKLRTMSSMVIPWVTVSELVERRRAINLNEFLTRILPFCAIQTPNASTPNPSE